MIQPDKYVANYLEPFAAEAHECPLSVTIAAVYQNGKLQTIKTRRERCGDFACGDTLIDKRRAPTAAASELRAEIAHTAIAGFYGTIAVHVRFCEAGAAVPRIEVEQTQKVA